MKAAERERLLALAEEWERVPGGTRDLYCCGLMRCADELRALVAETPIQPD